MGKFSSPGRWLANFFKQSEILLLPVKSSLWKWCAADPKAFQENFSMPLFKEHYASKNCAGGNPFYIVVIFKRTTVNGNDICFCRLSVT
eukprot:156461-Karenia_brevis.AAC.1